MTARPRRGAVVVLAASVLGGALAQGSGAQATEPEQMLTFSTDGVSYTETLRHPVLKGVNRIVPGSVITGPVWVRNNSGEDALLSVAALPGTVGTALEEDLWVHMATNEWAGEQKSLGGSGTCSDLAVGLAIPPGESVRLDVGLRFDVGASNATRSQSADFALRFLLQDSRVGDASAACADSRGIVVPGTGSDTPVAETIAGAPDGMLADTGVSNSPWLIGGAAAIGLGALLVALVRRRSSDERNAPE